MHQHQVYDTDNHFVIDPITKEIINQSEKMKLMLGDHNSERFTFEIPRYIDGHDMTLCNKIEIHYINIDSKTKESKKDVYIVDDMQLSPNGEDVVIFSWLISGNATRLAGTLNFRATFKCISEPSIIDYQMSTEIFKGITVSDGISNSEAVIEQYSDVLEQWKQELNLAGEYAQQIQQNASEIDELQVGLSESRDYVNKIINYEINWNDGGYISKDDGNVYDETGSSYSDYVTVMPGTKLIITNTMTENNEWNAFYDANKTFLSPFSNATGEVIVPDGAVKMRLSKYSTATITIASNIKSYIDDSIENVEANAKLTDDAVAELKGDLGNKVDAIAGKSLISDTEISRLSKVFNYDDTLVKESIKELNDKKITKFYANSLGETTLNDSDGGKIQDMILYGKSLQNDTPTPDNPIKIQSVVNPKLKVCGKNLLNTKFQTKTMNGVTITNNGDGTYTLNGTSTKAFTFDIINGGSGALKLKTGKYILNGCHGGSNDTFCVKVSNNIDSVAQNYNGDTIFNNETSSDDCTVQIKIFASGVTFNNHLFKFMLRFSSVVDSTYEPYKEQSASLPYTLNAIPVSSGGNVTIDGQQYIADYVDIENKKLVRNVGIGDLGTLKPEYVTAWGLEEGAFRFYSLIKNLPPNFHKNSNIISESYKSVGNIGTWSLIMEKGDNVIGSVASGSEYGFIIKASSFTSVNEFTQSMTGSMICYELATPTITDLTDEEVQAFKELVTYYPTTNVMITSDQLDGYTTFNYPISMENGWNLIKEQLGDTREYIYDMELQSAEAYVNSEYAVTLTELGV